MSKKLWTSKTFYLGIAMIVYGIVQYFRGLPANTSTGEIVSGVMTIILRVVTSKPIDTGTTTNTTTSTTKQLTAPSYKLPYPEQPKSDTPNTDIQGTIAKWETTYGVPEESKQWISEKVNVSVDDKLGVPAETWNSNGVYYCKFNPYWFNIGVVAFEAAHVSYNELTDAEKSVFHNTVELLKDTDPGLIAMFKAYPKPAGDVDGADIDNHAEYYRVAGQYMNDAMKKFYPKLLV